MESAFPGRYTIRAVSERSALENSMYRDSPFARASYERGLAIRDRMGIGAPFKPRTARHAD